MSYDKDKEVNKQIASIRSKLKLSKEKAESANNVYDFLDSIEIHIEAVKEMSNLPEEHFKGNTK